MNMAPNPEVVCAAVLSYACPWRPDREKDSIHIPTVLERLDRAGQWATAAEMEASKKGLPYAKTTWNRLVYRLSGMRILLRGVQKIEVVCDCKSIGCTGMGCNF